MEVDQADIADRCNAVPLPDVDSIPEAVNLAGADSPVTHATSTGDKTCALNVHIIGFRKNVSRLKASGCATQTCLQKQLSS